MPLRAALIRIVQPVAKYLTEPGILAAALALTLALLAFTSIADALRDPRTLPWDTRLIMLLRESSPPYEPLGPRWILRIAPDLSALGSPVVLAVLAYGVAGYLLVTGRWRTSLTLVVAVTGGALLAIWLKDAFARPRPDPILHLVSAEAASFPSGHSLLAAVVYMTVGAMVARVTPGALGKVYAVGAAMLLGALVGISRVYLGVHYPTDVLAGWAAGLACGLVCWMGTRR